MGIRFYFGPQMWPWSKLRVEDKGSEERRIHVGWVNALSNSGVKLFRGWWEEWDGAVQRTRANLNLLGTGVTSSQRLEGAVRAHMWDSVYILVMLLWWCSGVQCSYSDPFIYLSIQHMFTENLWMTHTVLCNRDNFMNTTDRALLSWS